MYEVFKLINQQIKLRKKKEINLITPIFRNTYVTESSQQWDFSNAWAPLQAFIIQGLDGTEQPLAKKVASKLADVWLRSNYKGFVKNHEMFEKV